MNGKIALQWKNGLLMASLFVLVLGPVVVLGGTKTIYVDEDNDKGSQDGSHDHPYSTIGKAVKKVKGSTVIFVAKGTYKENITLPKNTKLVGGKKTSDVVIKGDNDAPTITMKDDTEVNKITISGGRHGIRVEEYAEAKIIDTVVKDSNRDGVHIDKGTLAKKDQVFIEKSSIRGNRLAGIFSEKRSLVVLETDIERNGDGVDLVAGVKAWFDKDRIFENRGSGFKLVIDGASFWAKNTSIRRNAREGVEVNAYGALGTIGFKKSTMIDNGRYGLAKVGRVPNASFKDIHLDGSRLEGNQLGAVSAALWIR
jgi:hypothetical protein